ARSPGSEPTRPCTTSSAGPPPGTGTVTAAVGAASKSASVTVTGLTPPSNLPATSGRRRINLAWTGSGSGVTYRVYRGTSAGGETSAPVATGITTTSWTDRSATTGTTYYYYKVTAVGP